MSDLTKTQHEETLSTDLEDNRAFTISKAAEITGLSTDTLRYYEKIGLVSTPERSDKIRKGAFVLFTVNKKSSPPSVSVKSFLFFASSILFHSLPYTPTSFFPKNARSALYTSPFSRITQCMNFGSLMCR
ncbi:MerR family DNA-binding transcriptional regulator [Brevibacillus centrosporus]|uniref:MerR family regulatory protein n=1 Tax=Brevibacillus centrosporus TaxID=54910 RepID=A0A1I3MJC6_9BACL|nr:MerR family DNA-binding transcriptional regulator [Brevibacillus centrosporus]SFI97021.1 MerR family regulatory protein [Brevibacillus centrosporus]